MPLFGLFGPPNIEKLKEKRDVSGLIKALSHEQADIRRKAAQALGEIGDALAVEPLAAALKDKDSVVRRAAVEALGVIGDVRAVEPLVVAVKDEVYHVRMAATGALGKIGDARAVEPLLGALNDTSARALVRILGPQVLKGVFSQAGRVYVKPEALVALFQMLGNESVVNQLTEFLNGRDETLRRRALGILAEIGEYSSPHSGRRDKFWWNQLAPVLSDPRIVQSVVATLDVEDVTLQRAAMKALVGSRAEGITEFLLNGLEEEDKDVAGWATIGLEGRSRELQDQRFIQRLVASLKNPALAPEARETVAKLLDSLGWQPANKTERAFRGVALHDFRKFDRLGASAVPALIVALRDVRWAGNAKNLLEDLLHKCSPDIMVEDLQRLARIENVQTGYVYISDPLDADGGFLGTEPLDCSLVRQLARNELARRGINE